VTRIPLVTTRDGLRPEQRAVFDAVAASRGIVRGPFGVLLHRPAIAAGAEEIGGYLRYRGLLPPTLREAVILSVARMWSCQFEWTAHRKLGLEAGLDRTTLAQIEDRRFGELSGDIGLAVEFAQTLTQMHEVPPDLFSRVGRRWNVDEQVELAALIGYYTFLAVVLNAFDVTPVVS